MPHTGKDLGADLYDLEQVARSDLPTVSSAYETALDKCKSAKGAIDAIRDVPQQFVSDHGAVLDRYREVDGTVAGVLRRTRDNLNDTAEALHQAAQQYAENDQAAAAEFHHMLDDRGEPKPE